MAYGHTTGNIRHKFNAVRCELDGKKFSSKAERNFYEKLLEEKASGIVLFFLRQVPFDLPGGVKHLIDFQVFFTDGTVEFVEVKGLDTPMGKAKRKMVEDLYPIKIKLEKK
jgi:hypothetical protein